MVGYNEKLILFWIAVEAAETSLSSDIRLVSLRLVMVSRGVGSDRAHVRCGGCRESPSVSSSA